MTLAASPLREVGTTSLPRQDDLAPQGGLGGVLHFQRERKAHDHFR